MRYFFLHAVGGSKTSSDTVRMFLYSRVTTFSGFAEAPSSLILRRFKDSEPDWKGCPRFRPSSSSRAFRIRTQLPAHPSVRCFVCEKSVSPRSVILKPLRRHNDRLVSRSRTRRTIAPSIHQKKAPEYSLTTPPTGGNPMSPCTRGAFLRTLQEFPPRCRLHRSSLHQKILPVAVTIYAGDFVEARRQSGLERAISTPSSQRRAQERQAFRDARLSRPIRVRPRRSRSLSGDSRAQEDEPRLR